MQRKDVRSFILSLVLGDGCLSLTHPSKTGKRYGVLAVQHSENQRDYLEWKIQMVNTIIGSKMVPGKHKNGPTLWTTNRRFKAWRKFCYPGGKKDVTKILPFIRHPEFALAIWLMDDGYVEPSIDKKRNKLYSVSLRVFTCSSPVTKQEDIILWFQEHLGVTPKIKFQKRNKNNYVSVGDDFPFLKFTIKDSFSIWGKIREFVLQFESMRHKFRYIEALYQARVVQCTTRSVDLDDIVRPTGKSDVITVE